MYQSTPGITLIQNNVSYVGGTVRKPSLSVTNKQKLCICVKIKFFQYFAYFMLSFMYRPIGLFIAFYLQRYYYTSV